MTHVRPDGPRRSSRVATIQSNRSLKEQFDNAVGKGKGRVTTIFQQLIAMRIDDDDPLLKKLTKKQQELWESFEDAFKTTKEWKEAEKRYDQYLSDKIRKEEDEMSDYEEEVAIDEPAIQEEEKVGTLEDAYSGRKVAKDGEGRKQRVGGKLHKLVDSQIDNHALVSACVCVNNHVFSTVLQYLESDLLTPYDKESAVGKPQVVSYKKFGWSCHFCHWENDLMKDKCHICNKERNKRYYKMEQEYTLTDQIGTSELAIPKAYIYPEIRNDRWVNNDGMASYETWTRDENFMWNSYKGYDRNLRERNQLLFMLSMVTVEHYMKQQYNNVNVYPYNGGELYVSTKSRAPYALENRKPPWNEILKLPTVTESDYESKYGEKENEIEYESEYSDYD